MRVTFNPGTYASFGIERAGLMRRSKHGLPCNDLAALLASSFLINLHLYGRYTFSGFGRKAFVSELLRSIKATRAYDLRSGNFNPQKVRVLTGALSTNPTLLPYGGDVNVETVIEEVYHAVRLAPVINKSPFETLEALCDFASNIHFGRNVRLDNENIHYMDASPRKREFSYAFDITMNQLLLASPDTAPAIVVGVLSRVGVWCGGKLHIDGDIIKVDGRSGNLLKDPPLVVEHLQRMFSGSGYVFEVAEQ